MRQRAGGRFSWVEDGHDQAASPLTWLVGVTGSAFAAALAAWATLDLPALAAAAALILAAGALTGRMLRLDEWFRSSGAWMWAIGAGTTTFLFGAVVPVVWLGPAVGLFVLPLDWRIIPRLRTAVGAGMVFATLAVIERGSPRLPLLGLWAVLAAATLLLLERDVRHSGRQAARHRPPGHPPAPRDATRLARDALTTAGVAIAAVVAAVVVLPPPSPGTSPGRAGRGGQGDDTYWGFGSDLDTAVRAPRGDDVILRVRADTPALWRGDSYERFDGRRWTQRGTGVDTLRGRNRVTVPEAIVPLPPGAVATGTAVEVDEQVQVFSFERGGNDLVFAANRPRTVLVPGTATWAAASDAVRLDLPLGRGGSYTVVSQRPRITEDLLRALDGSQHEALRTATARPGAGGDPFAPYLAVPPSTTARTRALAAEVTAGRSTTIDRLRALEAWLGAHTSYRLDIPALPPGRDAVDQYLFEDRQGYCEQIASALAVLLRTLGVPTRLAVGFVPDHQDAASGEWIVKERNAHAWVEVWWPGVGWQGFDPTANVPLSPDEGASTAGDRLGAVAPVALAGGVAAAVAVAALAGRARWTRRRRGGSWIDDAVARLDRAGARAGRPRQPGETLIDYGDALDDGVLAGTGGRAGALGRDLSRAAFSAGGGDRVAVEGALEAIEAAVRHGPAAAAPVTPAGSG